MPTFSVHIYNPQKWMSSVEVIHNDTGRVIASHYAPGMTHERAQEIALDEVRLHTPLDGIHVPNIVDHWGA